MFTPFTVPVGTTCLRVVVPLVGMPATGMITVGAKESRLIGPAPVNR